MASWFVFTGSNPTIETQYTLVGSQPTCPGTTTICAVFAENDGGDHPILTDALKDEMIVALNNRSDNTTVLLKT